MVFDPANGFPYHPYAWQHNTNIYSGGNQPHAAAFASSQGPGALDDGDDLMNFQYHGSPSDPYGQCNYTNDFGHARDPDAVWTISQTHTRHASPFHHFQTDPAPEQLVHQAMYHNYLIPGLLFPGHHCHQFECLRKQNGQTVPLSFSRASDLRRHQVQVHGDSNVRYQCAECGRLQWRKDKMMDHCRKVHKQTQPLYRVVEAQNERHQILDGVTYGNVAWGGPLMLPVHTPFQ